MFLEVRVVKYCTHAARIKIFVVRGMRIPPRLELVVMLLVYLIKHYSVQYVLAARCFGDPK